ncbi:MAG: dirigent protein [Solirubrobacteraceae bacterium]
MPQRTAHIRLSAMVAAATAALALAALVAAGPTYARTAHASGKTVHVIEHAITDTEAPGVGGKDVKGNILTFNNPVFDTANSKQVGHDEGFCVRLQVKLGIWECLWTTFLKGGQITVQGPYYDTHNSELTITGGTGAYKGAGGQMDLKSRNGGKEYDFIFHLM